MALVLAGVAAWVGCGSSSSGDGAPATSDDGGASSSSGGSGTGIGNDEGGVSGDSPDGSAPAEGGTTTPDGGDAGGAVGSCLAPEDITLPFAIASGQASTASLLDVTQLTCSNETLPEAVFRLVLAQAKTVTATAGDASGQGVGIQVHKDTCTGTSVACDWKPNGSLSRSYSLPAGTWLFVLERKPAGPFTLRLE